MNLFAIRELKIALSGAQESSEDLMAFSDDEIRVLLSDTSRYPPCTRHLGFELIDYSIEAGWAEVAFSPRPEFANPAGTVQGGFVAAMLDDSMSFAATLSRRFEVIVPTLQTSVTYLRPTPIARVTARGEVLRFGTSSIVMQGTLRDAAGTALAVATATAVPRPFPR
jgi:uncharacterized protein (TIGR00369 family)